jgi:hypothetical protein
MMYEMKCSINCSSNQIHHLVPASQLKPCVQCKDQPLMLFSGGNQIAIKRNTQTHSVRKMQHLNVWPVKFALFQNLENGRAGYRDKGLKKGGGIRSKCGMCSVTGNLKIHVNI